MKIAILTLHYVANFGANLQAYATSSYLARLGYDVVFINYRPKTVEDKIRRTIPKVQIDAHENFVKKHFNETPVVRNTDEAFEIIKEINPKYLITGSDAVFRLLPNAFRGDQIFPNPFWLPYPKEQNGNRLIKAALAPSAMGCRFDILPKIVQQKINQCITDMDHVSVRDIWTANQLKRIGVQRRIDIIPDPVFLFLEDFVSIPPPMKSYYPYILLNSNRTMPPSWTKEFTKLANMKGYEVIALPISEGRWAAPVNQNIEFPLDPLEWMGWIANASGYIGVRFHPIVVSLIANVPFISVDTYHKGFWDASKSKTMNLLRNYNLQGYAYGRLRHLLLTPFKALCLLENQKKIVQKNNVVSNKMHNALQSYIKRILQSNS